MIKKYFRRIKRSLCTLKTVKVLVNVAYAAGSIVLYFINVSSIIKSAIFVILFFSYLIVTGMIQEIEKEELKLPKLTKRFTRKDVNGAVVVDEPRIREAILYLYEIEDRLYK